VAARFPATERKPGSCLPTGVAALDGALGGGLAAGELTELISGGEGCGGQLLLACLLATTRAARQRMALVDGADGFSPDCVPADALRHLVWVRARGQEEALAAGDVLARDGNYAAIVIDLRGLPEGGLRRTPDAVWLRLRRAAESRRAAVLVQTDFPLVPAVAWRLVLRMPRGLDLRRREQSALAAQLAVEIVRGRAAAPGEMAG
jgi:hypothetical protein